MAGRWSKEVDFTMIEEDKRILEQVVAEYKEWHSRSRPPSHPTLGIIEQLGELSGSERNLDKGGMEDAIAHVLIFTINLCNLLGIDLVEAWDGHRLVSADARGGVGGRR